MTSVPHGRLFPNSAYEPGIGLPKGLDLTCPTVSTCFAVNFGSPGYGGPDQIVATYDGGTTWNSVTLPVALADSSKPSLTCADATNCESLGQLSLEMPRSSRPPMADVHGQWSPGLSG